MDKGKNEDFDAFWLAFPKHVGKLAAARAYKTARKQASAAELLDGVERYIRTKPGYADYCYPATWLNGGRWMDELPEQFTRIYEPWICPHDPHCKHRPACDFIIARASHEA